MSYLVCSWWYFRNYFLIDLHLCSYAFSYALLLTCLWLAVKTNSCIIHTNFPTTFQGRSVYYTHKPMNYNSVAVNKYYWFRFVYRVCVCVNAGKSFVTSGQSTWNWHGLNRAEPTTLFRDLFFCLSTTCVCVCGRTTACEYPEDSAKRATELLIAAQIVLFSNFFKENLHYCLFI